MAMSRADRDAKARLKAQRGADSRARSRDAEQKASVRPRVEAEIERLIDELLPLPEAHGRDDLTAFRVAVGPYGSFRSNFKKDRAGWKVASACRVHR